MEAKFCLLVAAVFFVLSMLNFSAHDRVSEACGFTAMFLVGLAIYNKIPSQP